MITSSYYLWIGIFSGEESSSRFFASKQSIGGRELDVNDLGFPVVAWSAETDPEVGWSERRVGSEEKRG